MMKTESGAKISVRTKNFFSSKSEGLVKRTARKMVLLDAAIYYSVILDI